MTNSLKIKKLVGLATLAALVVGLQFLSNYVTIGSISITLALIPIAIGAILYGPLAGFLLGAIMGGIVLTAPSTAGFLQHNAVATVFLCLLKTGLAGLAAGFIFKFFAFIAKKQDNVGKKKVLFAAGIIVAALFVPVINTSLFIVGASIFFIGLFGDFITIINVVITTNFLIEFLVSAILSPSLVTLVKVLTQKYSLGFAHDFSEFIEEESFELEEIQA